MGVCVVVVHKNVVAYGGTETCSGRSPSVAKVLCLGIRSGDRKSIKSTRNKRKLSKEES